MIKIEMIRTDNGDDESRNLPAHYISGAGAGHGWFRVLPTTDEFPGHEVLSRALTSWDGDSILNSYDASTGLGRFVIVDGYAPAPGRIIELKLMNGDDESWELSDDE